MKRYLWILPANPLECQNPLPSGMPSPELGAGPGPSSPWPLGPYCPSIPLPSGTPSPELGAGPLLTQLAGDLEIHVITADTFGKVRKGMAGIPCSVSVLPLESQAQAKLDYVTGLGAEQTVCMGNGRNDRLMLKDAGLGVAVLLEEGAAAETLLAADVVCKSINDALSLLLKPLRLTATLRS